MIETQTLPDIRIDTVVESRLPSFDPNHLKFGRQFTDHMFSAEYRDGQWTNLRIMPYGPLKMSPATSALHYGQSIFEGLKAHKAPDGTPLIFRPEENARRLNASAVRMKMPKFPEALFLKGLTKLVQLEKGWIPQGEDYSLYLRPFMFATDEFLGVKPSETYRFLILASPAGSYYTKPVRVKVETHYTRAASGGTGSAKAAGNYAGSLYPAALGQQDGFDQLIWTDGQEHKYIEESGTMNIAFIIDGTLVTPALTDSILPGVTRKSVLKIARQWGLPVEERKISVAELVDAYKSGRLQDAFGLGTAATLIQIESITYNGEEFVLPELPSREISNRLANYLRRLKRGLEEDTFNWLLRI
ncbi:MAG: branched-chain amino acid aminotransferase [Salibacteraceae bacterium]